MRSTFSSPGADIVVGVEVNVDRGRAIATLISGLYQWLSLRTLLGLFRMLLSADLTRLNRRCVHT